jgi:hypothetical protein
MVNKVVMCLGTNDVSKCKDDSDQVKVLLTQAIASVCDVCCASCLVFFLPSIISGA